MTSEYVGESSRWPLMLRAEIRGAATGLQDAQQRLGARAGSLLPLVALAANAAHADPALVVAHGLSPDVDQPAEWIAYEWPPASEYVPPHSRTIEPNLVGALLEGGDRFPSAGYHGRAVGLYREALKHWTPETELLAGEYLWMATEALSRGVVEAEATQRAITPQNLAQLHGVSGPPALYARAREQTIFKGDAAIVSTLQQASDGFEHGYRDLDAVREMLHPILLEVTKRVRQALIEVLALDPEHEKALLAPRVR